MTQEVAWRSPAPREWTRTEVGQKKREESAKPKKSYGKLVPSARGEEGEAESTSRASKASKASKVLPLEVGRERRDRKTGDGLVATTRVQKSAEAPERLASRASKALKAQAPVKKMERDGCWVRRY